MFSPCTTGEMIRENQEAYECFRTLASVLYCDASSMCLVVWGQAKLRSSVLGFRAGTFLDDAQYSRAGKKGVRARTV